MQNIPTCGDNARHIAAKLFERLELQNISLNLDMYERWGHGSDPELNAMLEDGSHYRKVSETDATCRQLLANADPATRTQLANAFIYMLETFIQEAQAAKHDTKTAQYVAQQEIKMWQNYILDNLHTIDQNCYYVHYPAPLRLKVFGL